MAHQPMLRADDTAESPASKTFLNGNPGREKSYPFSELVRTLAQHGAGNIAADLALDLVLNDIVEQARVATGASGAAIALIRDEEMVCRATSGPDAPSLGVRLDTSLGLSGECVKSREVQLCADALTDPRVDTEACCRAGIRSIVVLPLLDGEELFGVFVTVARQSDAFGRLDTITLLRLARQVVENHREAHATTSHLPTQEPQLATWQRNTVLDAASAAVAEAEPDSVPPPPAGQTDASGGSGSKSRRVWHIDFWTAFFAVLVFGAAMFMSALAGWRLGVQSVPPVHGKWASHPASPANQQSGLSGAAAARANITSSAAGTPTLASGPASISPSSRPKPSGSSPTGGLVVYEKGKVVYRALPAPAAAAPSEPKPRSNQKTVVLAAEISPEIKQVSPEVAAALLVHRVDPHYPAEAQQERIQGPVVLQAKISQQGRVQKLTVVSGDPLLAESAMQAVKRWRYKPYTFEGRPLAIETTITVNFTPPAE